MNNIFTVQDCRVEGLSVHKKLESSVLSCSIAAYVKAERGVLWWKICFRGFGCWEKLQLTLISLGAFSCSFSSLHRGMQHCISTLTFDHSLSSKVSIFLQRLSIDCDLECFNAEILYFYYTLKTQYTVHISINISSFWLQNTAMQTRTG